MFEWLFGGRARIDGEGVALGRERVSFADIVDAFVEDGGVALVLADGTRRRARVPAPERPSFAAAVLASLTAAGSVYRTAAGRATDAERGTPRAHAKRKPRPSAGQATPLRWPRGLS